MFSYLRCTKGRSKATRNLKREVNKPEERRGLSISTSYLAKGSYPRVFLGSTNNITLLLYTILV
jgi:hypothetical protein